MEKNNSGLFARVRWIYKLITHGLFWHGVRNNLAKIGLDLMPYYYYVGTKTRAVQQNIKGNKIDLEFSVFNDEDMRLIKSSISGLEQKDFVKDIENGDICLGFKQKNKIAAYSLIKRKSFVFRKRFFELNESDIYIHSTYVFDAFRGRNIAPFMKYERFKLFETDNIIYHHSITEYFNKPALRIQRKLNSQPIALYLSVILFKTWTMNFTLKNYNQELLHLK